MKKVSLKKGVLAIAAIALLSASAYGKGKIVISKYLDTDYAIVSALGEANASFKVKVYDSEGVELYSSPYITHSGSYQKLFDLNSFSDGKYIVSFESRDAKLSEIFYVKGSTLVMPNKEMLAQMDADSKVKPFVRQEGNNLFVSHINFDKSLFHMSIDDNTGNEIYNSSLPRKTSYTGKFDLSKLPAGSYSLLLTSGNQKYYYEITK